MSDPWLKFYPTDWRSDPALKMCSLAARGLWIEMIALMHEAVPYGHLLVSGRSPTDAQLAVLAGAPSDQITDLIGELESAGVFSRTREGVIYSRKMTRTAKKAAIARKNGKKGGNPALCKGDDNPAPDNQTPTDVDKPQKPEARSQIREGDAYASPCAAGPKAPSFDDFWSAWPLAKVGKDAARKAFGRLSPQQRTSATAQAPGWCGAWHAANPRLNDIHPSTYLNNKRWEDETQPTFTLIPGGSRDQSPQHNHQLSRADATSLGFDVVARTRRASSEPLF